MTKPNDPSRLRRQEVIDALRRGTVPARGLELFAVGLGRFEKAADDELAACAAGRATFKAVRGDYGTGKTFFARWLEQRARQAGFATALVQISENDTPLYRMETVYRRALESLQTREWSEGTFRILVERWFGSLEDGVLEGGAVDPNDLKAVTKAVAELLEQRLATVSATQPQYAAALRACYAARVANDPATAEGLIAWLMAQPNVSADIKRRAGIKGEVDHTGASGFLRGLLVLLKQTGRAGLVLVLDEVETIQRVRADSREKSLNAIRQLIDDVDAGRYPGLYVLMTGTPQFFDGPQGVKRLPPLEQRLHVDFSGDPRFDNSRAVQIRLAPFDLDRLVEVGRRVRDLYVASAPERVSAKVNDATIRDLAVGVAGRFGQKTGIAPRIFLRKLVNELLDKVDEHEDYEPTRDFKLMLDARELTAEERDAAGVTASVDDIALDLGGADRS
jgi:bacteriophage exclusion system BrxC/D-like protein